jgi:UDP-N-acetylmuramate dehydrogenase
MTDPIDAARAILRQACGDRVRDDVPMAPLTTFRIGGPAALFVEPASVDDLHAVARAASTTGVSVAIVGKGSNVLVADEGFRGIVVRLGGGFRWSARDGDVVTAGGAMPLPAIAGVAQQHGLAGLGFGVAIPASLGGAIRMNAGAHDGQMADVVASVDMIELATDRIRAVPADEVGFAYRSTALPADAVIVAAKLRLRPGDPAEIRAAMDAARRWRRQTQPIAEPNCGSVFTNPPGQHAAALIDAAGLKGAAIGGASVSTKHANFIVTRPGARAADVRALIDVVRAGVTRASGVVLQTEVRTIGGTDV